ncbi:unnamed protein product [Hymenolepis diminuta]|uniref:Uncharacterized protein n=1 Tax=Hymenolepis diminuta TaxID=6216 RepID=A0A564YYU5_HYMDI|nr:unnamed protein product [Hymenolepis diminuta]VUZ55548.1 unnamed protein product [Hymenolepis diminuta]
MCSSSPLKSTQDVAAESNEKVDDVSQPNNPPSDTSGENSGQTPPENSDKNTETPGDDNTGGDKTQQPGDDKTTSTSTTSKSSHLSLGFAISFSSLLISFVF